MSSAGESRLRVGAVLGASLVVLLLAADLLVYSGFLPTALSGIGSRLSGLTFWRGTAVFLGSALSIWASLFACLLAGQERRERLLGAGALLALQAVGFLWLDGWSAEALRREALVVWQGAIPSQDATLTLGAALRDLSEGGAAATTVRAWLREGSLLLAWSLLAYWPLALTGRARLGWGFTLSLGVGVRLAWLSLPFALALRPHAWAYGTLTLLFVVASLLLAAQFEGREGAGTARSWTFRRLAFAAGLTISVSTGVSLALPPANGMEGAQFPPGLSDAEGQPFLLSDLNGRVALVTAWSPTCRPCARELDWFRELRAREPDWGLELVVVSVQSEPDGSPATLEDLPQASHLTFPREHDAWLPAAIPASWLLDREGRVRERSSGFTDAKGAAMEESIRALVRE